MHLSNLHAFSESRLSARMWGATLAFSAVAALCGVAKAGMISITNPNFATDTSGWTTAHSFGSADQYDAVTNPQGSSSSSVYSVNGGVTNLSGYPGMVTTAGTFTMDAYDITNPVIDPITNMPSTTAVPPNPHYANISATARDPNLNWSTYRISSGNGDLGSFYQDTGVQFAANTTYTLTAYASGNDGETGLEAPGSPAPFSNTGVGLSGTSALTMSEISASPNVFNNWGDSPYGALTERTLTLDTADYPSLVGQDIIVNLLADTIATGGGTAQWFTGTSLTYATDVPEPASISCLLLGVAPLALRRRRSKLV